jgi:TolA-binding protein
MQDKYGPKGVVLVTLSYEPAAEVRPYVKKHRLGYIVGSGSQATNKAYGINGYPTFFVIDPDGKVVFKGHSSHQAEESVKRVLKENPPKKGGSLRERAAKSAYKKALKLQKRKKYAKAIKAYESVAGDFKGTRYGKKAKSKLKKINSNKRIMAKVRHAEAKKKCESWLQLARALARDDKRAQARKYYRRIIKEFPDTEYAEVARGEMVSL